MLACKHFCAFVVTHEREEQYSVTQHSQPALIVFIHVWENSGKDFRITPYINYACTRYCFSLGVLLFLLLFQFYEPYA